MTARAVSATLMKLGYETIEAATAAAALAIADETPLDLVTMDMFLPDGDGLAICGVLRAEHSVPVILLSGIAADLGQMMLEQDFGPDAFLPKPLDPAALAAEVARLLDQPATRPVAG